MFGQFINRVVKITDLGLKYGKGFGKRAARPPGISITEVNTTSNFNVKVGAGFRL